LATAANYTTYSSPGSAIFHAPEAGTSIDNTDQPCLVISTDPGCTGTSGSVSSFGYATSASFPYYSMAAGLGSIDGYQLYTALAVTATPTYTAIPNTSNVTISAGNNGTVTFTLSPTNYTGSVTLTAVSSSSAVTASFPSNPVSLASGAQSVVLTISASSSAMKHSPAVPWKSGGVVVFAVLLGAPFTLRRKRALAVLVTALAISTVAFMAACGGGGSSSSTPTSQTFTVTVTPTGSGTVTNPASTVITVTVP
jgi:hypothetical protein